MCLKFNHHSSLFISQNINTTDNKYFYEVGFIDDTDDYIFRLTKESGVPKRIMLIQRNLLLILRSKLG